MRGKFLLAATAVICSLFATRVTFGQTYGVELKNNVMPASGGMAGTSFSQPQDLQSAMNANPATLVQFPGTQFSFGGAFVEPTYNVSLERPLPLVGVDPYSGKSSAPPSLVPNIGVVQQHTILGRPVTLGVGFLTNAGLAVDFRQIPESNGSYVSFSSLDLATSMAVNLTSRWSVGSTFNVATSTLAGPFVDSSSSQTDYATRFSFGSNYELAPGISAGLFWQSKKNHTFDNVAEINGTFRALALDLPTNMGLGLAHRGLMNGRLLVAADVLFEQWSDTDFFGSIYKDQWAFQFGTQYAVSPRLKLRAGYGYTENPMLDQVPGTIGGVIPIGGIPAVQYVQTLLAPVSEHRITGGVGIRDLMPGVDFDTHVGGAFLGEDTFGPASSSVESWWLGFGFTWRRGNCAPQCSASDVPVTPVYQPTDHASGMPSYPMQ